MSNILEDIANAVKVHIVKDDTRIKEAQDPRKEVLQSILKTWAVDPTGTNAPTFQIICDAQDNVEWIEVWSPADNAFVITGSIPRGASSTAANFTPPDADAIVCTAANGGLPRRIYGPGPWYAQAITGQGAARVCVVVTRRVKR